MTVPKDTTYPPVATDAAWQKKKSFLDKTKSKTKTGLGAKLKLAEASWKQIPWGHLDGSSATAGTPATARKLLEQANKALLKVNTAKIKLNDAMDAAAVTKTNKGLSKTASTAAGNIENALKAAIKRLETVKVTDFERLVKATQPESAAIKMDNIRVQHGNDRVMTGTAATWDRKVLKVTGVKWEKGTANDIQGKKVIVRGDMLLTKEQEQGTTRLFTNDMKLSAAQGNTASFVAY